MKIFSYLLKNILSFDFENNFVKKMARMFDVLMLKDILILLKINSKHIFFVAFAKVFLDLVVFYPCLVHFIRLTGERGFPILPKLFESVKYKGKGHEVSDLNAMMGVMEHWGHRLFPKMPFDELIERVERLGQKKQVQVKEDYQTL